MGVSIFSRFSNSAPASDTETNAVTVDGLGELVAEQPVCPEARQQIIELYHELKPSLHAYLCWLGMNSDQAEDVVQETFLRLVGSRMQRGPEDNLRAWVFRVAHNLSMDVHRFQRRWSWNSQDESRPLNRQQADPGPSPEQRLILDEQWRRLQDAFHQLTPKQRQCVLLRAQGFRYREIACILGISVQRVGELMQRSITLLEVHT